MPAGDYANTRYSKLNQINASNVGKLQVAWTFSTGVLRGHEGGPLIMGNTMYVHTPFPNNVYALDLSQDGQDRLEVRAQAESGRHPGDVLRHRQPWALLWRRKNLSASGRRQAGCARLQDGQARVEARQTAILPRVRPALRRRWWSRTRCWSEPAAASSASTDSMTECLYQERQTGLESSLARVRTITSLLDPEEDH